MLTGLHRRAHVRAQLKAAMLAVLADCCDEYGEKIDTVTVTLTYEDDIDEYSGTLACAIGPRDMAGESL